MNTHIAEVDEAGKNTRVWIIQSTLVQTPETQSKNSVSEIAAMKDGAHLVVSGNFLADITFPDGTTKFSNPLPKDTGARPPLPLPLRPGPPTRAARAPPRAATSRAPTSRAVHPSQPLGSPR